MPELLTPERIELLPKKYIPKYRDKFPDDSYISDDDLIDTPMYAYFAFHESVVDFGNSFLEAICIKALIEKISNFLK